MSLTRYASLGPNARGLRCITAAASRRNGDRAASSVAVVAGLAILLAGGPLTGVASAGDLTSGASPSLRERLQEISLYQSLFGGNNSPVQRLLGRVQAVQDIVQRAELLVRLGDSDGARALLRGQEAGLLSYDLAYGAEVYRLLPQQAGRQVLSRLEAARAALAASGAQQQGPQQQRELQELAVARLREIGAALRAMADVLEAAAD